MTFYNTNIFKISRGFSSKLKPYNSANVAIGRACLHEHFCACQLCLKKPNKDQDVDHLDHPYGAILCDSYYVFRGFARGVSVVNFVFPRRPPSGPALRIRCVNEPSANAPTHEGAFAEGASESVSHGLRRSEPLQAVQECIAGSHFRCIFEMQPASQQRATQHASQLASQPGEPASQPAS